MACQGRKVCSLADRRWKPVRLDFANASVMVDKKCEFHGSSSVWNPVPCGYLYVFAAANRASSENSVSDRAKSSLSSHQYWRYIDLTCAFDSTHCAFDSSRQAFHVPSMPCTHIDQLEVACYGLPRVDYCRNSVADRLSQLVLSVQRCHSFSCSNVPALRSPDVLNFVLAFSPNCSWAYRGDLLRGHFHWTTFLELQLLTLWHLDWI